MLDPIIEMNADGLNDRDLDSLKRLGGIEESEYALDFYDFENYLRKFANTFVCEVSSCQKMYFDQSKLLGLVITG